MTANTGNGAAQRCMRAFGFPSANIPKSILTTSTRTTPARSRINNSTCLASYSIFIFEFEAEIAECRVHWLPPNCQGYGIRIQFDVTKPEECGLSEFVTPSQVCSNPGD